MKIQVRRPRFEVPIKLHQVWQYALPLMGFGVAIFLAAIFGLNITNPSQHIPVLWLPSGIVLSILLLTPRNKWLPVFLVFTLANSLAFLVESFPAGSIIGFTFAYAAEALLAALIVQWIIGQKPNVFSLRQIGLSVLSVGSLMLLTALLGATVAYFK